MQIAILTHVCMRVSLASRGFGIVLFLKGRRRHWSEEAYRGSIEMSHCAQRFPGPKEPRSLADLEGSELSEI